MLFLVPVNLSSAVTLLTGTECMNGSSGFTLGYSREVLDLS